MTRSEQVNIARRRLMLAGVAAVALTLAGCGKRGPLEPPPGSPDAQKREEQAAQPGAVPNLRGGAKRPPLIKRPKDPFILDAILD